ncbi:MAG TPA: metal-dependent hydrolase [archaeon]|jgi:L-ascorbate metabolism protein UlaG (beta-lactamase superfamily)|nr:metal-dependent hydrolase [archaeon]HPV65965.1 metal-dependent hydrolase [archaeon]
MKIKYIGHACFVLEYKTHKILIDPFISKNPLIKASLDNFNPDLILVSHDHFDHVGDTEKIAKVNNSSIICENGLGEKLKAKGLWVLSGTVGDTINYKGIEVTFVKAVHRSDSGVATGLIIKTEENTIYFAGDTDYFIEIKEIAEKFKPDIAILPVGGVYTIDPKGAIEFLKELKPKYVIPMHYKTFMNLYGTPEQLQELIEKENLEVKQITLEFGQSIEL